MHFAFLFVLFTLVSQYHFSSHFSSPFRSLFDHSSAERTKRSRKVVRKVAEKEPKMATVNDPIDCYYGRVFLGWTAASEDKETVHCSEFVCHLICNLKN